MVPHDVKEKDDTRRTYWTILDTLIRVYAGAQGTILGKQLGSRGGGGDFRGSGLPDLISGYRS